MKLGTEVLAIEHCLMAMGTSRKISICNEQSRRGVLVSEHFERAVLEYEKAYRMYARCLEDRANHRARGNLPIFEIFLGGREIPCLRYEYCI